MEIFALIPFIYGKIILYSLAFARIAAFLNAFIIFRRWIIAQRTIISLTSILSFYAITINHSENILIDSNSWELFYLVALQSLLGFIAAIILNIAFEVFSAAGQIISSQIGLSMASQFDPKFGNITSLTQFYLITASIIFFSINGHLFILQMIVDSFQSIPIEHTAISKKMIYSILNYSEVIFSSSVLVALTLIVTIMLINIALAFVTKFAPQFNVFSVGINITLILGLVIVYITYQNFVDFVSPELQHAMMMLKNSYFRIVSSGR